MGKVINAGVKRGSQLLTAEFHDFMGKSYIYSEKNMVVTISNDKKKSMKSSLQIT